MGKNWFELPQKEASAFFAGSEFLGGAPAAVKASGREWRGRRDREWVELG